MPSNMAEGCNREALAIESDTSLTSTRPVRVSENFEEERGLTDLLRTDKGREFLVAEFAEWCGAHGIHIDYIEPGKPNQNTYSERLTRLYRMQVFNVYLFRSLDEVRGITWNWLMKYNEKRAHDALGRPMPVEFYQ